MAEIPDGGGKTAWPSGKRAKNLDGRQEKQESERSDTGGLGDNALSKSKTMGYKKSRRMPACFVAPSDIISNHFLEDLERIWELKKWIPDPCNPYLHYLKPISEEEKEP